MTGNSCLRRSIGVLAGEAREDRHHDDLEVEPERPVLDVGEIVVYPPADLFDRLGLATPAVDLCPAGNARLDAMPRRVLPDRLLVQQASGLGGDLVRPRPDDRHLSAQHAAAKSEESRVGSEGVTPGGMPWWTCQ